VQQEERHLACRCGERSFELRIERDQQVGLLTCPAGHHALLLDSRDCWGDVIQDRRPPLLRCRCRAKRFTVTLSYAFRDDGDVRAVAVDVTCTACGKQKRAAEIEIDYGPTGTLVTAPLDPCEDPWVKARRRTFTGFWKPADIERVIRLALPEGDRTYFAGWREAALPVPVDRAVELVVSAIERERSYDLFVTNLDVAFPAELRDCWKALPLVHLSAPTRINCPVPGPTPRYIAGSLYYLEFAEEVFRGVEVIPQPRAFVDFTATFVDRLRASFVSTRGANTLDDAEEYARLEPALRGRG
jgi:hypothetical protein